MCLVISLISFVYGFVLYNNGKVLDAAVSASVGIVFFTLMIRNILKTRKTR